MIEPHKTYLFFSPSDTEESIRARFIQRFGITPEIVELDHGWWFVGPIPKEKLA
jgi:hypothetical protein